MKINERFRIIEFQNPKSSAFRVYGRQADGIVVRENFKNYGQALARKQELEIQAINSPVVLVMQPTRLSTAQLRDAEAACQKLTAASNGLTFTLLDCVEYFLKAGRSGLAEVKVQDAFTAFMAEKQTQNLRPRTLFTLQSRVGRFINLCGNRRVSEIGVREIKQSIQRPDKSPVTFNGDRGVLHSFFAWCARQDYCATNPVSKISPAKIERLEPTVLSLDRIKSLLRAARDFKEGTLVPYFYLALFCGLRPMELQRLTWQDVDLENRLVTIRGAAAKLRARRVIELTDNAMEWLKPHYLKTPIAGANWRRDFDSVRRAVGFKGSTYRKKCDAELQPWQPDVLRHSATSYWQAQFKDEGACADRHGNSVETVHRFYRALVTPQDAREFWQLTPQNLNAARIIQLPREAAA